MKSSPKKKHRWSAFHTTERIVELETADEEEALTLIRSGNYDRVRDVDLGWDLDYIGEGDEE